MQGMSGVPLDLMRIVPPLIGPRRLYSAMGSRPEGSCGCRANRGLDYWALGFEGRFRDMPCTKMVYKNT